jgi:hypothetical protein
MRLLDLGGNGLERERECKGRVDVFGVGGDTSSWNENIA